MDSIKIHVLHCGNVRVDEALPFGDLSKNPFAYTGMFRTEKHKLWLPVSAYFIEHPKGNFLVDTGWGIDVRENPQKALGFFIYFASKPDLPQGQAIIEQLEKIGVSPSELDYVIMTHLDADHAGGLKAVKDAKRILANPYELKTAKRKFRYSKGMWESVNIEAFHLSKSRYGPYGLSCDLFGDNSVILIHLPGHSDGMTGVLIQSDSQFVLLTGDCGYAVPSWEQLRLPGITEDRNKMLQSLKWVKTMYEKECCVKVLANHDTEVKPQIIEIKL